MSEKEIVDFAGNKFDVRWDGRLCIHIGECGKAKGDLFVGGRQPWCMPDAVSVEEVREVVERCPSGALSYTDKQGAPESAPAQNTATLAYNGPLYLAGELQIQGAGEDMPGVAHRAALCRCGASKNKPFCDNSHIEAGFEDFGAVGESGRGILESGGPLAVRPLPDGPVELEGNLTIRAASGRAAWKGTKAYLCRCGASKNKPFCDGSHKEAGFTSD